MVRVIGVDAVVDGPVPGPRRSLLASLDANAKPSRVIAWPQSMARSVDWRRDDNIDIGHLPVCSVCMLYPPGFIKIHGGEHDDDAS